MIFKVDGCNIELNSWGAVSQDSINQVFLYSKANFRYLFITFPDTARRTPAVGAKNKYITSLYK